MMKHIHWDLISSSRAFEIKSFLVIDLRALRCDFVNAKWNDCLSLHLETYVILMEHHVNSAWDDKGVVDSNALNHGNGMSVIFLLMS